MDVEQVLMHPQTIGITVGHEAPDVGDAKALLGPALQDTALAPLSGVPTLVQPPLEWRGNLGGCPAINILWRGTGILGGGLALIRILRVRARRDGHKSLLPWPHLNLASTHPFLGGYLAPRQWLACFTLMAFCLPSSLSSVAEQEPPALPVRCSAQGVEKGSWPVFHG